MTFASAGHAPTSAGLSPSSSIPFTLQRLLAGDEAAYAWLLLLRFALLNLTGFMLVLVAWHQGLVGPVFAQDQTGLCVLITFAFLAGMGLCAWRTLQVSRELNAARDPQPASGTRAGAFLGLARSLDGQGRANLTGALRLKLGSRLAAVRHLANGLVMLGLIGTVIGFMLALSGVDPEQAADISAIAPMVSDLIAGMAVALSTTLVGAVLNVWLMLAYRVLEGGATRLVTCLTERAEAMHGRP